MPLRAVFITECRWIRQCFWSYVLRPYDDVERIVNRVIGCAIEVHRVLGPGLLESVYQECLPKELRLRGLVVQVKVQVPLEYKTEPLRSSFEIDLLVERCVVVEVRASAEFQQRIAEERAASPGPSRPISSQIGLPFFLSSVKTA